MRTPELQPDSPWHGRAIGVARRDTAWHTRATGHGSTLKIVKNQHVVGAASDKRAQARLSHKNKGFALVCSLLRYVCTFYEGRRSEWGVDRPFAQANAGQKPACEMGQSPSICIPMTNRFPLSAALIAALLTSTTALADGWSNLGGFDPDEAAQIRQQLTKPASAQQGDWNQFGTSDDWVALDKFERGTPGKNPPRLASFRLPKGTKVDQLYALIEFAESPKAGYDAIHHSARKLTTKRPTQMTLGEIKSWIRATPGQHHAIGRFQVIPSTFANLQKRLRLPDSAVFNRATQDKMAGVLLSDAGYHDFIAGDLTLSRFMDNLALIWAGFPMAHGKSNYHGYAGNRATVTRAFFEKQMTTIFVRNAVPDGDDQAQPERVAKASTARPATPGEDR